VTDDGTTPTPPWAQPLLEDSEVERALVVVAHPDDVDFGSGGSVATWVSEGHEVSYCICTSGDAGAGPEGVPRDLVPALREEEQRAAAAVVGVADVTFLRYPDGRLQPSLELRRDISRVIRRFRPERVVGQSPERVWDRVYASHPDHLAAGEATACAVYPDARNEFAHPELLEQGFEPWTVPEMWINAIGGAGATTAVDITDAIDKKVAALRAHASQTSGMADLDGRMRAWGESVAAALGLEAGRMAEGFRVVDTR
jgi:LmbE family N-acetylglucosaminyl deacetylase